MKHVMSGQQTYINEFPTSFLDLKGACGKISFVKPSYGDQHMCVIDLVSKHTEGKVKLTLSWKLDR